MYVLDNEVNFLTEDDYLKGETLCSAIKTEFDLIRSWQGANRVFGSGARGALDNYIALSLRKLLCDHNSPILKLCPTFKMPPLFGTEMNMPGDENNLKLIEIYPFIGVKPDAEWISLELWLNESVAWIEKDADSIPDAYGDYLYSRLAKKLTDKHFNEFFECQFDGKKRVWRIKDPARNKQLIYELLKANGYYNLTIKKLIKHIADKNGAHMDDRRSIWIRLANSSSILGVSAVSAFASQMIYAATKQVKGLHDYYDIPPVMEGVFKETIL